MRKSVFILSIILLSILILPFHINAQKNTDGDIVLNLPKLITITPDDCGGSNTEMPPKCFQEIIDAHPPGSAFFVKKGVYRLQSVALKDPQHNGDNFYAEPGVILNGSKIISYLFNKIEEINKKGEGVLWIASNQTQLRGKVYMNPDDICEKIDGIQYTGCILPEDLFIDNKPIWRVTSIDALDINNWYFDYDNHKIYLKLPKEQDPRTKNVEISVADYAFSGAPESTTSVPISAKNIIINGFIIEKYATPAHFGTLGRGLWWPDRSSDNWIVTNNEVRWNHSVGITLSNSSDILDNYVHDNGQGGISSGCVRNDNQIGKQQCLIAGNEIAHNDWYAGFTGFDNSGNKLWGAQNVVYQCNYVHENKWSGLWSDTDNKYIIYEKNLVFYNGGAGIHHEVSDDAKIRNNIVVGNGKKGRHEIRIVNSNNVEVFKNTIQILPEISQNQPLGGMFIRLGKRPDRNTSYDNYIHNNTVTFINPTSSWQGVTGSFVQENFNLEEFSQSNKFNFNTYIVPHTFQKQNARLWAWGRKKYPSGNYGENYITWETLQGEFSQEKNSTFKTINAEKIKILKPSMSLIVGCGTTFPSLRDKTEGPKISFQSQFSSLKKPGITVIKLKATDEGNISHFSLCVDEKQCYVKIINPYHFKQKLSSKNKVPWWEVKTLDSKTSSYTFSIDTHKLKGKSHIIKIYAYDWDGNQGSTQEIPIVVNEQNSVNEILQALLINILNFFW